MSYTVFDRFVAWRRFRAAIQYVKPRSRVCDVGCGIEASFLRYAQSQISWGLGLDYQSFEGSDARHLPLVQCDLTRGIPLTGGQFNHVVMLAVLEHIANPEPLLTEIFRILVPGGSIIMTWPEGIVDPILNILHAARIVSGEMESDQHQVRIPLSELIATLKKIGFIRFRHRRFEVGLNNLLVSWKP